MKHRINRIVIALFAAIFVMGMCSIAYGAQSLYTVTVTTSEGGSYQAYYSDGSNYEPSSDNTVPAGTSMYVVPVPNDGFEISDVTVNGEPYDMDGDAISFTVNEDTVVNIQFVEVKPNDPGEREDPDNPDNPNPDDPIDNPNDPDNPGGDVTGGDDPSDNPGETIGVIDPSDNVAKPEAKPEPKPVATTEKAKASPNTADESDVMPWIALMILAGAATCAEVKRRNR